MNLGTILAPIGTFLSYTWWLILFLILWPLFKSTWRFWREELYQHSVEMDGILLEIRVPREITKSVQAMEQVLNAMHQLRNSPGNIEEWWFDGEVTKWFSLEMVSLGGQVHFYVRVPDKRQRHLVEAAFYAFYQDVELIEAQDYMDRLPIGVREMHTQGYDMWGAEMVLTKSGAYPIKTYRDFESPDEDKQYDPISQFVELLAKVKPEEIVAIQILIAPLDSSWAEHFQHSVVDKLRTREDKHSGGGGTLGAMNFPGGPMPSMQAEHEEKQQGGFSFFMRTPGETNVLEAVENNLSQPAFETVIRFIYLSPQPTFWDSFARRGLKGAFNQYAANDLNSFTVNKTTSTQVKIWDKPYIFPKLRNEYRKARLIYNYRHRALPPETFMGKFITSFFLNWNFATKPDHMTSQCIATIFHPPTAGVLTGPHVARMESRRVGPPAGLPIFGEETDLERYQQE
jgi:hypothetical protein